MYRRLTLSVESRAPRTSEVLMAVANAGQGERILFGEFVAAMRNRAFGLLFLLFGLPNCLPMPPGVPVILGVLLVFVALQMAIGFDSLWIPGWLGRRSFRRADLQRVVLKSETWIRRLEQLAKPRYAVVTGAQARRVIGLIGVVLGLALTLPIPLIGNIPLGIPVVILGLGLVERDGIIIMIGYGATVLGLSVLAGLGWLLWQGALSFL